MLNKRLSSYPRLFLNLAFAGLCVVACPLSGFSEEELAPLPEHADSTSPNAAAVVPDDVNPSIELKGSVWRTKPGIVFLKTPIGLLTLSSKTTLKDFRASHEVEFVIHGKNFSVDIRRRTDGSLAHRYLGGPLQPTDLEEGALRRWTPEGDKLFHSGVHEQSLSARRDGDLITVEVDDSDTVIGLHDLQFDLQIGQLPAGGSDAHLLLRGTISKLKSNFIFFRTPIGVVNVNAKIGIKNAKVGQAMTLHIHGRHIVADLSPPQTTAPARRFVTGPLEFATPERTSVRMWTPEGEQTYPTDRGKAVLAGTKEGAPITVELNGQGAVMQFHRFN